MSESILYRLLDHPLIYRLTQILLSPGAECLLNRHWQAIFPRHEGRVLDVGCGPQLNTSCPNGHIFGLDINLQYVKGYCKGLGQRGVVGSSVIIPYRSDAFDEVRSFGLLHHLSDEAATMTIREMVRCVRPNGMVIIIDGVWPINPFLRPLAWLVDRLDRGKWFRHERELLSRAKEAYPGPWKPYRFTYTWIGHEAVALTIHKTNEIFQG